MGPSGRAWTDTGRADCSISRVKAEGGVSQLLLLAAEPEGERGEDHPDEPRTRGHPGECTDLIRVPRKGPAASGSHSGEKVGEGADIDQVWSRDRVRR